MDDTTPFDSFPPFYPLFLLSPYDITILSQDNLRYSYHLSSCPSYPVTALFVIAIALFCHLISLAHLSGTFDGLLPCLRLPPFVECVFLLNKIGVFFERTVSGSDRDRVFFYRLRHFLARHQVTQTSGIPCDSPQSGNIPVSQELDRSNAFVWEVNGSRHCQGMLWRKLS